MIHRNNNNKSLLIIGVGSFSTEIDELALIHPTAYVSADAQLSPGCIIRTHAVVSRYARLGEGVIVNVGALIDHHCEIGRFSHILMGAVVRNSVRIEAGTWVSANTVVE